MGVVGIAQQVLNGLTTGLIYGLDALGFTMVYKALNLLNFSHAQTLTIGALMVYALIVLVRIPTVFSIILAVVFTLLYGYLLERLLFYHFRNASKVTFMLASISVSSFVSNANLLIWGPEPRALPPVFGSGVINMGEIVIPMQNIYIVGIAILSLVVLQAFFYRTKFGLAMRAAAEDPEVAELMGIKVSSTRAATFAITAALGGIAGVLIAPLFSITLELGNSLALKAFIAAVVGGVGNLPGALGAGLLLGLLEAIGAGFISSGYRDALIYAAGITVLAFKPAGLFQRHITKH